MPHFGEMEQAMMSAAVAPLVQNASVVNGGSVTYAYAKRNGSILLNPATSISGCTVNLPSPPADGQILTIGATKQIDTLTFVPAVPSSPGTWAQDDNFQFKYYTAINKWVLLK